MGEYAEIKSTSERVKIGTCESMYYLRYEDRDHVRYDFGDYEYFWRLPFPDEDAAGIGTYDLYNRGAKLYKATSTGAGTESDPIDTTYEYFGDPETVESPGIIQLKHPSGLLLNVPCYHGEKLPEVCEPMRAFWNGKDPCSYELAFLKNTPNGVLPVVRCRFCGNMWRYSWAEVLPFVADEALRDRLAIYA